MRNLADWVIAAWLLGCLMFSVVATAVAVVDRDVVLLSVSSVASVSLGSLFRGSWSAVRGRASSLLRRASGRRR